MNVRIAASASASKAHPGVQNHIGGKFPDAMDDVLGFHFQPSKKGINHEQYMVQWAYSGNIMGKMMMSCLPSGDLLHSYGIDDPFTDDVPKNGNFPVRYVKKPQCIYVFFNQK